MTAHPTKDRTLPGPLRTRVVASIATVTLSVATTGWLVDGVREGADLSSRDQAALSWMVGHRESVATHVMTAVTMIGGEVVLAAIAALTVVLLVVRRRVADALLLALALGSAEGLSLVLKHAVGRVRPPGRSRAWSGGKHAVVSVWTHHRDRDLHLGACLPVVARTPEPKAGMSGLGCHRYPHRFDGHEQALSG